jgi:hypothetical protein
MKKIALLLSLALLLAAPGLARAGFTETAPQGTWLLDISYVISHLNSMWNNRGESVPLIDQMIRYEPGAGKQGILTPEPTWNSACSPCNCTTAFWITSSWESGCR